MTTVRVDDAAPVDADAVSDEELAELAMAADPDADVPDDAIPLSELLGQAGPGTGELLPGWYMPPTVGGSRVLNGWRRRIVLIVIASFILINAYGLCSTYGHVGFG
ncbi:MAG TPA: hypothetical protein VHT97_00260 [Acidimicrobiales bacterium]|nr:hypothetical protein [Acidimicrobiales bacterium]